MRSILMTIVLAFVLGLTPMVMPILTAAPVGLSLDMPNPNLAEGVRIIPENYKGFGADLIFYPGSTWSVSFEDLVRKNQTTTDDDFNDWQGMVEFLNDSTGMIIRTHDGAGYILTMNVGQPIQATLQDWETSKLFSTSNLAFGQVIPLLLTTNAGTQWWSGNTNNGIGDANQLNSDHRVHAIISCVEGNCTGNPPVNPVPEPATYALMGGSLLGLGILRKLRR